MNLVEEKQSTACLSLPLRNGSGHSHCTLVSITLNNDNSVWKYLKVECYLITDGILPREWHPGTYYLISLLNFYEI